MAATPEVFSLFRFRGAGGCGHHLLTRAATEQEREAIKAEYLRELGRTCPGPHTEALLGAMQATPVGQRLRDDEDDPELTIWIAASHRGWPELAIGTAESEVAPPAHRLVVDFRPQPRS